MANKRGATTTGVVSESGRKRAARAAAEAENTGLVERVSNFVTGGAEAKATAAEAEAEVMEHAKKLQRGGMRGPEALKRAREMRNNR